MVFSFVLFEPGSNIRLLHVIKHISTNIGIYFVLSWKQFKTEVMREILFRGKTRDDNEWVYGSLTLPHNKKMPIAIIGNGLYEYRFINPETVGQFTGLTDKNGVKIFEGDIVNHIQYIGETMNNEPLYDDRIVEIIYNEECLFYPIYEFCECNGDSFEVIGNIHDNK